MVGLFRFLMGLFSLPTGTGGVQLTSLLLGLRQFGFKFGHSSTGLGGSFHGSFSHHTITHRKGNRNERNFI